MMSFKPGKISKRLYSLITFATTRSSEISQMSLIDTSAKNVYHSFSQSMFACKLNRKSFENRFLRFDELFLQDDEDTISELIGDQKKIRDKIFKNIISKVCF